MKRQIIKTLALATMSILLGNSVATADSPIDKTNSVIFPNSNGSVTTDFTKQGVSVDVWADQEHYTTSDLVSVDVSFELDADSQKVDIYMFLLTPEGDFFCVKNDGTFETMNDVAPMIEDWSFESTSRFRLLDNRSLPVTLPGKYTFYMIVALSNENPFFRNHWLASAADSIEVTEAAEPSFSGSYFIGQENNNYGMAFGYSQYYTSIKAAQSFMTKDAGVLDGITIELSNANTACVNTDDMLTASLARFSGSSDPNSFSGTDIEILESHQLSTVNDIGLLLDITQVHFQFNQTTELEANTQYVFLVELENPALSQCSYSFRATSDVYAEGSMYDARESLGGIFGRKTWDAMFDITILTH